MAKNHYTDEFKQQIVGLYKSGKTSGRLSNDYQIGKSTVWKWVHEFNNSGSFKAKDNRTPEENELIDTENEISN
ncbi:transposase [Spiroplasma endosymbiont of Glossina fuscipes fuscipes]|uniref:transposase n=1 Tax=Spiroplasma endosymbiont of Glossina fuscipes fuscipes TaxID=2004463 RepID=UPI003C77BD4A